MLKKSLFWSAVLLSFLISASAGVAQQWGDSQSDTNQSGFGDSGKTIVSSRSQRMGTGAKIFGTDMPVSGLAAEYLFEGNARDTSGREHHGTEEGGLTYVAGKIGKAAGFDGKKDGIRIADDRELEFGKGAFTISAWIYPEVRSRMMAILDHMIDTGCKKNTNERSFLLRIRDNRINLVMNGKGKLKYNHQYKTRNTIKANQWHFIAVRYDGASITIYLNQKKVLEARYSGGLFDSSAPWYIGARHCRQRDPQWFKGKIDNLRVYRRALTEAQIRTLLREGDGAVYDAAENTGARIQWMGAEISDITPEMHRELHLASGTGALVDRVNRGGGSEKAGLRKGDIITHINSASVAGVNELLEKSSNIVPGQLVRIRFIRDGQSYVTKTRLSDSPALSQSSGHRSGRDGGPSGSEFLNALNDALQTARDNNIESGLRNPDGVDDPTSDRTVQAAPGAQEGIATENRGRILTRQDDTAVNLLGERAEPVPEDERLRRLCKNDGPVPELHKATPDALDKDVIIGRWQGTKHVAWGGYHDQRYGDCKGFNREFMDLRRARPRDCEYHNDGRECLYVGIIKGDGIEDYRIELSSVERKGHSLRYEGLGSRGQTVLDNLSISVTISAEGYIEMYYSNFIPGRVFYKIY